MDSNIKQYLKFYIYCIRLVFDILKTRRGFAYKSHRLASPQYSDAFIDWIVNLARLTLGM